MRLTSNRILASQFFGWSMTPSAIHLFYDQMIIRLTHYRNL